MAIKYLAGERIIGTAAERAAMSPTSFNMSDWKLIARETKTSNDADGMSVSFPD